MTNISEIVNSHSKLYGLYIGQVVNNTGDLKKHKNKVQVLIPGFNQDSDSQAHYIWAKVASGIAFGGKTSKDGIHSVPSKGSFVYIQFLFGDPNEPVIIGGVRADGDGSDEYVGEVGDFNSVRNSSLLEDEVEAKVGKYPNITALEGINYTMILDDTEAYPQVKFMLSNGSYWELRPDLIQMKSKTDLKTYVGNDYFLLVGNNLKEKTTNKEVAASDSIKYTATNKIELNTRELVINSTTTTINSSGSITFNTPLAIFSKDVSVNGKLGVAGTITSMTNVFIKFLGLLNHTHKSNKTGEMSGIPTNNTPGI